MLKYLDGSSVSWLDANNNDHIWAKDGNERWNQNITIKMNSECSQGIEHF